MLSIGAVRSSMAAASYFAKDNYYTQHDEGPSHWFGAAAEKLTLQGEVEAERFQQLLDGRIEGDVQLGRIVGGARQHLHGWDLTFSAPKSVTLAALVGGDERLVQAHDAAVREALAWIQEQALITRTGERGQTVEQRTGSMLAAVFRHDLSRAAEPQLHSHAVVMNATPNDDGEWTSVHSIHLFAHAKEAGERYQQALAKRAVELGYTIVPNRNGTFELDGIPRELTQMFSTRAKAIEARLTEQGLTRATSTGLQREEAALRTRTNKTEIDRVAQRSQDRATARQNGVDLEYFVAQARERSRSNEREGTHQQAESRTATESETALRAVREAAEILSERDAAFTARELGQRARTMSLGDATASSIDRAVGQLAARGELVERMVRAIDPVTKKPSLQPGWTTKELIETERSMLQHERAGRGAVDRFMNRLEAQALVGQARALAESNGFRWTHGQAEATIGILSTSARVIGIQGYAGTAKTTTVLATVAEAARRKGYFVKGMAPTTDATQALAHAIRSDAVTVQRQVSNLTMGRVITSPRHPKELWIVDEASLVGARSMEALLAGAARQNARVLLVGDEKQLGSVEAGRAFGQLQDGGMPTFHLTEIVRQTNEQTKASVYAALRADAARALAAIERGGGEVMEIRGDTNAAGEHERRAFLAERYAELSPEERATTVLADPSREGRRELNEQVRETLKARGELQGPALTIDVLVPKGLTTGEQRKVISYDRGDVVRFRSDLKPNRQDPLKKDRNYTMVGRSVRAGLLQLQSADGRFVIWRPEQYGASHAEVYGREQREIAIGDRVAWTRNLPAIGVANGQVGHITAIDAARRTFTVETGGKSATLTTTASQAQHLEHAYAQTAHKLQGRTADRALLHVEDWRLNLIHQRSFYVLLSRAKDGVTIATSDRRGLIEAIRERSGEPQAALDELERQMAPSIARDAVDATTARHSRQPERRDIVTAEQIHRAGSRGVQMEAEQARPAASRERERDDDLSY